MQHGRHWYAEWLLFTGNFRKPSGKFLWRLTLIRFRREYLKDKGIHFYYNRQYDEAIDVAMKTLELDPNFVPVHRLLSWPTRARECLMRRCANNQRWGELTREQE